MTMETINFAQRAIIEDAMITHLHLPNRRLRRHSPRKIAKLAASLKEFGFIVPILVDASNTLVTGEARLAAAVEIGLETAPVIRITHLTPAQIRAYRIADNKLSEGSNWDEEALKDELEALLAQDFNMDAIGFELAELDVRLQGEGQAGDDDHGALPSRPILRAGDCFRIGDAHKPRHAWMCANALDAADCAALMGGEEAAFAITDPPFNVKIAGHVSTRRGARARPEFAMASGEMAADEFQTFLATSLANLSAACAPGALIDVFMDWRSIHRLIHASEMCGLDHINLVVWAKHTAGMGSLYRSQHELVAILRKPGAPHINNVALGANGRSRSNLWSYAGCAGFGAGRNNDLARHPTPKPAAMIADAILDCTRRGDSVVLDLFAGGGTTAIAAERTGRRSRLMEIDPGYCEASIRRFAAVFGETPVHAQTGLTLDELGEARARERSMPATDAGGAWPALPAPEL